MAASRATRKNDSSRVRKTVRGSVSKKSGHSDKDVSISLRLPSEMLEQVDTRAHARRLKTPRNRWILEAVYEKLDREADEESIRVAEDRLQAIREGRSHAIPLEQVMREHGNLEG